MRILALETSTNQGSIALLERAVKECVEIDEQLADCHLATGNYYWVTGRQDRQIAAYERAIDILENHEPYPLPEGADAEMQEVITAFEDKVKKG